MNKDTQKLEEGVVKLYLYVHLLVEKLSTNI
jgi:hypothetical protein